MCAAHPATKDTNPGRGLAMEESLVQGQIQKNNPALVVSKFEFLELFWILYKDEEIILT